MKKSEERSKVAKVAEVVEVRQKGFTLIEVLVVMGIIAVLSTIVLVAINPSRQFAESRDTQRTSNVTALLNAIGQRAVDNRGIFETGCVAGQIPATTTAIKSGVDGFDLYPCIVPVYIALLPTDPKTGSFTDATNYDSGYTVARDEITGRITIAAPSTEIATPIISISR
jgi:prepilin-type N-terminal cleavage/methylation domain-containing protein